LLAGELELGVDPSLELRPERGDLGSGPACVQLVRPVRRDGPAQRTAAAGMAMVAARAADTNQWRVYGDRSP
jgi:hypothetical protein